MSYRIETTPIFDTKYKSIDRYAQRLLRGWIKKNLENGENLRSLGAGTCGPWRYRVGDYRIICHIDDDKLVILALSVGHQIDKPVIR